MDVNSRDKLAAPHECGLPVPGILPAARKRNP
jgi:hypothetical protein